MAVRCLVGFYGLNRSLRWTAGSIVKKILAPLSAANVQLRCIAHFNEPTMIHSEHSEEFDLPVTRLGLRRLPLDAYVLERQEESRLPRAAVRSVDELTPGPRLQPRPTMINLLSQLYSLKQLWMLAQLTPDKHDIFIFLRPDLEYLDRIEPQKNLGSILSGEADLITPSWQQWGGLNDRFAFCSQKGAEVYANRIDAVKRFCDENDYLNAEELLGSVARSTQLKLRYTDIRAMRVRADGATLRENFDLNPYIFVRGIARKRIEKVRATFQI